MAAAGVRGVRRTRAAVAAVMLATLTACTTAAPDPPPPDGGTTTTTVSPFATPSRTGTSVEPPVQDDDPGPVRIALVGDIHFEGVLADRLRDPATALTPVSRVLSAADLTIANLETSIGTSGRPE